MDENLPPNQSGEIPPPPLQSPASMEPTASVTPPTNPVTEGTTVAQPQPATPTPTPPPVASAPPPLSSAPPRLTPPPSPVIPPPPMSPPPPLTSFSSPAPRKSGRGWKIFALLLFLALICSVLFNLKNATRTVLTGKKSSVHHKREYLEEITLEDNASSKKIAVIEIEGVISSSENERRGHNMVDDVRKQFEAAEKDSDVKAVILKVNSPGGEVLASDEIYNTIREFQQNSGKPVVASMQTLAASGGYYVSAPCRWIVANEMTLTGSVGVIMHGFNFSGLMDKVGIQAETYKSGKYKDMLSPFRHPEEISDEERQMVQGLIMETYGKFTNIVATGRSEAYKANSKSKEKGQALADNWASYADGRVLSGTQAYELGFVDELGNFEAAKERTMKLAGIHNANFIQYQEPFDFGDFFRIFVQTESKTVKVDLGMDLPKLQPGCLYFLYRQALP